MNDRERDRQTDRDRKTDRQTDRQTERNTEPQTERDRERGGCRRHTYRHDHEVEPAPSVAEVGLEAEGHPLDDHLHDENGGETLVQVVQHHLHHHPLFQVHVLKGLVYRKQDITNSHSDHLNIT